MPVTEKEPINQEVLKQTVRDRKPGEEGLLVREVTSQVSNILICNNWYTDYRQFGRATAGLWRICKDREDVPLTPSCIVYIILGKCIVGGRELSQPILGEATVGYLVTGETLLEVQSKTIVIIFDY